MRVFTWLTFLVSLPFAVYCAYLPLAYVLSPNDPFRGEMMIGWFWITVYGFIPTVILAALSWLQRKSVSRVTLTAWALPAGIVLASAAVMYGWAVES